MMELAEAEKILNLLYKVDGLYSEAAFRAQSPTGGGEESRALWKVIAEQLGKVNEIARSAVIPDYQYLMPRFPLSDALKKIKLVLRIGPTGFEWTSLWLTDQEVDPAHETKGEGQCLVFALIDRDCSNEFYDALEKGEVLAYLKGRHKVIVTPGGHSDAY